MWNEIFNLAISNGIFACLFVALLVYVLKDSRKREAKYQNTIDILANKLSTVDEIKEDVTEIKKKISHLNPLNKRRKDEKTN